MQYDNKIMRITSLILFTSKGPLTSHTLSTNRQGLDNFEIATLRLRIKKT